MSEKRDDGGPAFPAMATVEEYSGDRQQYVTRQILQSGMSLRDHFAAQSFALGGEFFHNIDDHGDPPNEAEHAARVAYAIADAMLAERKK